MYRAYNSRSLSFPCALKLRPFVEVGPCWLKPGNSEASIVAVKNLCVSGESNLFAEVAAP